MMMTMLMTMMMMLTMMLTVLATFKHWDASVAAMAVQCLLGREQCIADLAFKAHHFERMAQVPNQCQLRNANDAQD